MAQPSHIAGFLSLNNVLPCSLLCILGDLLPLLHCGGTQSGMWAHLGASHLPRGSLLPEQQKHQTGGTGAVTWHWWSRWEFSLAADCHTTFLPSGKWWELAGSLPKQCPDSSSPLLRAHSSSGWWNLRDLPEICSCMHVQTHWFTHLLTIMHFQDFSFMWKSYFWAVIEHLEA